MNNSEIQNALEPVLNIFDELGILYYIGGSVASSAYGIARATMDIDLVSNLKPVQVKLFVEKLKELYFVDEHMINDAIKTRSSFNLIHLNSMIKIDVFILKDNLYYQTAFERKREDNIFNEPDSIKVFLCSAEDVILNKLEWFKLGGGISDRQWNDILGVFKVQQLTLDKEYLTNWSKKLGLEDLLNKAFQESQF
jgi:hypothetical protein